MPTHARKHRLASSLIFHIYNRSNNRVPIFSKEADCRRFIDLLSFYRESFLLRIYHWCIMHTHFHLLLELPDPRRISRVMAGLGRAYTHYHHNAYGTCGFLWQGRFGSQPIQKERYLLACGRNIERNPVRANIVEDAGQYRFSSAGFYCLGARDEITDEDPTIARFGADPTRRRAGYALFLNDFNPEEEALFKNHEAPAGDWEFTRRLQLIDGRPLPQRRGRPRARIPV
jgi:putative transposase